ncbi:hypothetical protein BJ322DRAFT_495180 [Thelephora terrestris]|uniref:Erythromycin biosynthesis protein CIII-like C-terminal domain-containing protein n=1 Tax=Thelephora terrestris TaxID=56493 RepID=A0A9P6H4J3_9AGAM|nr:hypothetical protein BJ322DRAFT_495180 [Thelephora terrestris]
MARPRENGDDVHGCSLPLHRITSPSGHQWVPRCGRPRLRGSVFLAGRERFEGVIEELLANPKNQERFKMVDWIHADPAAVMNHPNVTESIHHGGANSYYEAARAGIPQIILAQWFDLYEMATRAEYRGLVYSETRKSHLASRLLSLALRSRGSSSQGGSQRGLGHERKRLGSCAGRLEGRGQPWIKYWRS